MKTSTKEAHMTMLHIIIRKITFVLTTLIIIVAMAIFGLFIAGIRPYVVKTGSMEPAFPVNCLCFVNKNTPLEEISVGDVISFTIGKHTVVTHRVTSISGKEYTTKGDANLIEDSSPVTAGNYIGKIVFMIPKIGSIPNFLHTKAGLFTAVTVILLLLITSFLSERKKETDSQENTHDDKITY